MLRGPQGHKRPPDLIGAAIILAKIATGEIEEEMPALPSGRVRSGKVGARARTQKLPKGQRVGIARLAAYARWSK
jgi:hypothetical protein